MPHWGNLDHLEEIWDKLEPTWVGLQIKSKKHELNLAVLHPTCSILIHLRDAHCSMSTTHGPPPIAQCPLPIAWPGGMRGAIKYGQPLAGSGSVKGTKQKLQNQKPYLLPRSEVCGHRAFRRPGCFLGLSCVFPNLLLPHLLLYFVYIWLYFGISCLYPACILLYPAEILLILLTSCLYPTPSWSFQPSYFARFR